MELTTKKKSYRWNKAVSTETTQKITETFIDKKSCDLLTSSLKLLNESIQECGITSPRVYTWDEKHPLVNKVTTSWLDFLATKEADRTHSKDNAKLENISSSIQDLRELITSSIQDLRELIMHRFTALSPGSLESVGQVQKVKSKNQVAILSEFKGKPVIVLNPGAQWKFRFGRSKAKMILENIEAIEAFVASKSKDIVAAPVPQSLNKVAKKTRNKWTNKEAYGSHENKKKFGEIMRVARKTWALAELGFCNPREYSQARITELIKASPWSYEGYIDYTGLVRNNLNQGNLSGIELGKWWPAAKALHALVEFYELGNPVIEEILGLLPEALKHSIKKNLDSNSRTRQILLGELEVIPTIKQPQTSIDKVEEKQTQEEEKFEVTAEVTIPDIVESLGEITEPVYRTKALKIAVLGMLDKNTARQQRRGFGRHTVVFVDGDKPKSIQPAFYDGVVALNRVSHTSFSIFCDRCGNPPQLRFKKNGEYRVNSVNLLRAWFEQYDKGDVEIW